MEKPDPKPVFRVFLKEALELGILDERTLVRYITPLRVFQTMPEDPENRARIYEACTGYAAKFGIKKPYERQVEDIDVAIATDESVAKTFVLAVGIAHIVDHVPLVEIYSVVMDTGWSTTNETRHRMYAALLCSTLVEQQAFKGRKTETQEQIMNAISFEQLVGDKMPAELRARMMKAFYKATGNKKKLEHLGDVIFDAVSFTEMSQHLDVAVMAAPIVHYAKTLGLIETGTDDEPEMVVGDGEADDLEPFEDEAPEGGPPTLPGN